jgi:hypothetical protein
MITKVRNQYRTVPNIRPLAEPTFPQCTLPLKVHKRENFLGSDIEICTYS